MVKLWKLKTNERFTTIIEGMVLGDKVEKVGSV